MAVLLTRLNQVKFSCADSAGLSVVSDVVFLFLSFTVPSHIFGGVQSRGNVLLFFSLEGPQWGGAKDKKSRRKLLTGTRKCILLGKGKIRKEKKVAPRPYNAKIFLCIFFTFFLIFQFVKLFLCHILSFVFLLFGCFCF